MSKRTFRTALIVVISSVVLVVGLIGFFVHRAFQYPDEAHDGSGKEVEVEIVSGMSFPSIASLLEDKGVLSHPTWFRIYAMWNGKTADVKTGKYVLKDNLTPSEVLDILVKGVKEVTIRVTLPEGENMLEFFKKLEDAKVASAKELEALARDKEFLGRHAIVGDTPDGYLFPDTYNFRHDEKPGVVLHRMITRHQEVWNSLLEKHAREVAAIKDKMGWSDRDILTMASIVEKEAVDPKERPRIAQVFINRLTFSSFKSRRLETDPTIRYGCLVPTVKSPACQEWIDGCVKQGKQAGCDRLHEAQLKDKDNPYNTYQHEGLPPGPIANPGRASMEATLTPDGSDYLYFVATSKNSRNHAFARTAADHEKNVEKYKASSAP
jgi:peptidoglycan lytic transglycosylase G